MKSTLIATASALAMVFAVQAGAADEQQQQGQQGQQAKPDVAAAMKKLDVDKDGTISKEEATQMRGLSEVFDSADANKDGKLDAGEFAKAVGGGRPQQ
jgi:EF hand